MTEAPTTSSAVGANEEELSVLSEEVEKESGGDLALKFDALGVIVLASDGTMFRIRNWNEMIESEKRNTLRLISRRNEKRKADLIQRQQEEGAQGGGGDSGREKERDEKEGASGDLLQIANEPAVTD